MDSRYRGNSVNPNLTHQNGSATRSLPRPPCLTPSEQRERPSCWHVWSRDTFITMSVAQPASAAVIPGRYSALWVGTDATADLRLAKAGAARLADLHVVESATEAVAHPPKPFQERSPAVILMASSSPGGWPLGDAVTLSIRWPLAPVVSVAASLVDGRRRSGPAIAGVEEVPWHDLPGRLAAWLSDRDAGRPGVLGLPATARREEGIFEGIRPRAMGLRAAVAAMRPADLDGLADLVAATGASVAARSMGRPPLDDTTEVLLWDVGMIDSSTLAWLRMLVANRPGRCVIVLESFPRAETTRAALDAGAAAVMGRPCGVEALAGTLLFFRSGAS